MSSSQAKPRQADPGKSPMTQVGHRELTEQWEAMGIAAQSAYRQERRIIDVLVNI
jgi:hypothetical protein